MKAYILNRKNGSVQIGNIVYQPSTGAVFSAGRGRPEIKGAVAVVEVPDNSMESARLAIDRDREIG